MFSIGQALTADALEMHPRIIRQRVAKSTVTAHRSRQKPGVFTAFGEEAGNKWARLNWM
jgi:hypothetical protein